MGTGAITGYFDVAQIALYLFWIFFAGLLYYLQKEAKREGFPLEMDVPDGRRSTGWLPMPAPKTFLLRNGETVTVPNNKQSPQILAAEPANRWSGSPLEPTGNPMLDGVGPGAYADRADVPDLTLEGDLRIVPLRAAAGYGVATEGPDPRGMAVVGDDGVVGGTVVDAWVDRSEAMFRYYEIELAGADTPKRVLLPVNFSRVSRGQVKVKSILGGQFALVPQTRLPEQITLLEEEKIMAYYGAGTLYATPARQEPFI
jgi:photosynthetic reaction center H subunit